MTDLIKNFENYLEQDEFNEINKKILIKFFIIFIDFLKNKNYKIVYDHKSKFST